MSRSFFQKEHSILKVGISEWIVEYFASGKIQCFFLCNIFSRIFQYNLSPIVQDTSLKTVFYYRCNALNLLINSLYELGIVRKWPEHFRRLLGLVSQVWNERDNKSCCNMRYWYTNGMNMPSRPYVTFSISNLLCAVRSNTLHVIEFPILTMNGLLK